MYELHMYDDKFNCSISLEQNDDINYLILIAFERFNYGSFEIVNVDTLEFEQAFTIQSVISKG